MTAWQIYGSAPLGAQTLGKFFKEYLQQMENEPKLILLADVIESKVRKEGELAYYEKELKKLQEKMFWIQRDIDVTNIIIDMVKHEKVLDVKEQMESRMITDNNTSND